MARSIEFDYGQALDRATRLFWAKGYVGTSLRDLLKVLEIGEGSFYNTFKSKKHLYVECLKRYADTEGAKRAAALNSAPTASLGIRAMFAVILDCLDDPKTPSRMCMIAAMICEDVIADPDLRLFVDRGMERTRQRLAERLLDDRDKGELPASCDPQILASVITTYLQGTWRMALLDYDRSRFERQIDAFLKGLHL